MADPGARRARRQVLAAVTLALLAGGIALAAMLAVGGPASEPIAGPTPVPWTPSPSPTPDDPSPRGGTIGPAPVGFSQDTGVVLVFDNGGEGARALDLDSGDQQRIELPGQRAGDQPYRLHRMGGWLVVGWGTISAVAPGSDLAPRQLGEATIFVPAAEPDQLWLVDHASGRTVVGGLLTATLIDSSGTELASVEMGGELEPLRGVPGGLALRRPNGSLAVHDLAEGRVRDYLGGSGPASLGDVERDRVLWCEQDPCTGLRVSNGAEDLVANLGDGEQFHVAETWLSGDGSLVAAVVTVPVDGGVAVDRRLRVYDVDSGLRLADVQLPLGQVHGDWSIDGHQFLSWLSSPGAGASAPALLGRWAGGGEIELVDVAHLGLVGLHSFVTLPRQAATGIFAHGEVGEPCPVSARSEEMGSLPTWRGDRVHVGLLREAPTDRPVQVTVGIPDADASTSFSISSERLDGPGLARFFQSWGSPWELVLHVSDGMRFAVGYPPHWGLAVEISDPGCWAFLITTEDGIDHTVVIELAFDPR